MITIAIVSLHFTRLRFAIIKSLRVPSKGALTIQLFPNLHLTKYKFASYKYATPSKTKKMKFIASVFSIAISVSYIIADSSAHSQHSNLVQVSAKTLLYILVKQNLSCDAALASSREVATKSKAKVRVRVRVKTLLLLAATRNEPVFVILKGRIKKCMIRRKPISVISLAHEGMIGNNYSKMFCSRSNVL